MRNYMVTTTLVLLLAWSSVSWAQEEAEPGLMDHGCVMEGNAGPALNRIPAPYTTLSPPTGDDGGVLNLGAGGAIPNRVDIVFVGDGYTQELLDLYAQHVDNAVTRIFATTPFKQYQSYFNVHRVDVVSNEAGVDNAPTLGVQKDTAMNMQYWCGGVERLLCIDTQAANAFAANAPDVDLTCALARNQKYGGAGYPGSMIGTSSGANSQGPHITVHEIGHAFANLADEYWFNDGSVYPYSEGHFPHANLTTLTEAELLASNSRWAAWIGNDLPQFDGPTSSYEGAFVYQFGARRPSPNSLMRNHLMKFNGPSAEALLLKIYSLVDAIDASSDINYIYDEHASLWVSPMAPSDHALDIQWLLFDEEIPGATGETLDLCALNLPAGWHQIKVRVSDPTPWVKGAANKAQLSDLRSFIVNSQGTSGIARTCEGRPNSVGAGAQIDFEGTASVASNDLQLRVSFAPANKPGLFFLGTQEVATPLGEGLRCAGGTILRLATVTTDATGNALSSVDLSAWQAGDRRLAQFWYRDPSGGTAGFNLSDALDLRLCP